MTGAHLDQSSIIDVGAAGMALGDHAEGNESGDLHVVVPFPAGALVAVIDGLGHGTEAAAAARAAAVILAAHPGSPVVELIERCHEGMRRTRGAVMSLCSFSSRDSSVTWIGVGNVEGLLLRGARAPDRQRETIPVRAGVVGYQLPPLRAEVVPVSSGDTLIMMTDGIRSGHTAGIPFDRTPQQIAEAILDEHNKHTDDALVLVARYRGPMP